MRHDITFQFHARRTAILLNLTLHWNSCRSLNAFRVWSTLSPGTSFWIWILSSSCWQFPTKQIHKEIIELCNLCTIWKYNDTFPKKLIVMLFMLHNITFWCIPTCQLLLFSLCSRLLDWEPITAKPRSPLVFWFVELAQSLLRSFLFPVESLAGSVNCKMIGYSSSHENIMVYLLE